MIGIGTRAPLGRSAFGGRTTMMAIHTSQRPHLRSLDLMMPLYANSNWIPWPPPHCMFSAKSERNSCLARQDFYIDNNDGGGALHAEKSVTHNVNILQLWPPAVYNICEVAGARSTLFEHRSHVARMVLGGPVLTCRLLTAVLPHRTTSGWFALLVACFMARGLTK